MLDRSDSGSLARSGDTGPPDRVAPTAGNLRSATKSILFQEDGPRLLRDIVLMEDQGLKNGGAEAVEGLAEETLSLLERLKSSDLVGFGFIDQDFRFVRVNEKLAAMNGHSVAEHIGRAVAELVPQLWPQIEPLCRIVLCQRETLVNMEISGKTDAEPGLTRYWATSFYPVSRHGRTLGVGLLVTDVTTRKESEAQFRELTRATVAALAATVETRDPYTAGHQRRVSQLASSVAAEMGLDRDTTYGIELTASIHDIGKIGVPAEILIRPGPLRPPQFELIKEHSQAGSDIIAGISFPWPVAEMVAQHHERFDGSGYPRGLRGRQILVGASIIAAADALDAMTSYRPYRPALGGEKAMEQLAAGRRTQFDPDVVDVCLELFRTSRLGIDS
jgi:PAS domain S-box-containing protein